mgnify:CR=1 FL=1
MGELTPLTNLMDAMHQWLGTPYHPQASLRGVGVDCSGLHRGVARDLGWDMPPVPEPHATILLAPDWMKHTTREVFLEAFLASGLTTLQPDNLYQQGDILLFGFGTAPASHAAWCTSLIPPTMIHAVIRQAVVQTPITPAWQARLRYVLRLTGVQDE